MSNRILCPACFDKLGKPEEKTCTHGSGIGVVCTECGAKRVGEWGRPPYFHCLGKVTDDTIGVLA